MTARLDAIVVNYHGAEDTARALASLPWSLMGSVHVVDNSVDADEAARLRALRDHWPALQLHVAGTNLGFGRACNLAWAQSTAEQVLLLNPDARLRPGAVEQLLRTLEDEPRCAAVAPRMDWTEEGHLVLPNLTSQSPSARVREAWATRWAVLAPQAFAACGARHARRTQRAMGGTQAFSASALSGAVLLLRRRAVEQSGGLFDPAYFMFFEDTDLSRRLRAAGWRLRIQPRARAWHAWHHRPEKAALMAQSERIYLQRHHPLGDRLQRPLVAWLAADPWRGDPSPVPQLRSADDVRQAIGPFLALTPLPSLHPAGVRADGLARVLSDEEWGLLDAGRWYAWPGGGAGVRWRRFDVVREASNG